MCICKPAKRWLRLFDVGDFCNVAHQNVPSDERSRAQNAPEHASCLARHHLILPTLLCLLINRVKASGIPGDAKVKFVYSTNIRKQVKPALPVGYWGNGCVPIYVQMSAAELVERPVWHTADMIKKSKRNITDEYVRSFIDFQELYYADGIAAGECVSGFTDWRHLGHSAVDFGWGGPVTVQPLSWNLLGSVEPSFFLPYSSANEGKKDGFKVLVSLPAAAVPAFKEEMEIFNRK